MMLANWETKKRGQDSNKMEGLSYSGNGCTTVLEDMKDQIRESGH